MRVKLFVTRGGARLLADRGRRDIFHNILFGTLAFRDIELYYLLRPKLQFFFKKSSVISVKIDFDTIDFYFNTYTLKMQTHYNENYCQVRRKLYLAIFTAVMFWGTVVNATNAPLRLLGYPAKESFALTHLCSTPFQPCFPPSLTSFP